MQKISLKGISEILSERELKNVMGGNGGVCFKCPGQEGTWRCSPGDCLDYIADHCPYGWMSWGC
jgi:natural product precursor